MEDIYEGSISMGLGGDQYDDASNWENYKKEKCINCGAETPYAKDTHIDNRAYYEYGVGQLCQDCYNEIYTLKDKDDRYMGSA
jgi:hypothetical protein